MVQDDENGGAPPPGEFSTIQSKGTTPTEQELAYLARRTFLSLWSYPNLWRDQRVNGSVTGAGKELCDLLVVFENHVVIFSDKAIEFQVSTDIKVAWERWYSRAVTKSIAQIRGAERWIRQFPERIFLDSKCTKRFPLSLLTDKTTQIHRIVVARGAGDACQKYFGEGSGSLMISSGLSEEIPFCIGLESSSEFVHILDDASLQTLMSALDTVKDFVDYLVRKEKFISSGKLLSAGGEEDLVAYYLTRTNSAGEHDFVLPIDADLVVIPPGEWDAFQDDEQRKRQLEADKVSYTWDRLIESFSFHVLNDSQYFANARGVAPIEPALRLMARESRVRRRLLSESITGLVKRTLIRDRTHEARVVAPSYKGDPFYVFLALRKRPEEDYDEYRKARRARLFGYVQSLKAVYPHAEDIVGIGLGRETPEGGSEDLIHIDTRAWTQEDRERARTIQKQTGFLNSPREFRGRVSEYPEETKPLSQVEAKKGRNRNAPCPCGSGLKLKRCHGRSPGQL